jgi:hypothetical protein
VSSRTHLTVFAEGPRAWLVLVRNVMPVVGVFASGWPASIVVLAIWFDGVSALAVAVAASVRGFARNDPSMRGWALVSWVVVTGLFGIPYWFVIVAFGALTFESDFVGRLLITDAVGWTFAIIVITNTVEAALSGVHRMTDAQIRREFDWTVHTHLARVAAMILVLYFVSRAEALVVGLALALSYVELYPIRALRFFGGTDTLSEENLTRSED